MNRQIVATVLTAGKMLAPDRFPAVPEGAKARGVMLDVWVRALAGFDLPADVWQEAVVVWATELAGDRMVTPRDLVAAARVVRDRWDGDPERRALLDAYRVARANRNYARAGLDPITVDELPHRHDRGELDAPRRVQGRPGGLARLSEFGVPLRRGDEGGKVK